METPRFWLALCVVLTSGCLTPASVRVEVLTRARVRLHFPPVGTDTSVQGFTREDARRVLQLFHEELAALEESKRRVAAVGFVPVLAHEASSVEGLLLRQYTERYGEPTVPLPDALLQSPLAMALRLSPKSMPEGIREGWEELVRDPAFLAGLMVSLAAYVVAWAAPEPVFPKAFAASVTVVLVSAFTLTELVHAGGVTLKLYLATRHARTLGELEEAARDFGQYAGGAALRVMAAAAKLNRLATQPSTTGSRRSSSSLASTISCSSFPSRSTAIRTGTTS